MRRRSVLSALALGAFVGPHWLRRAFGDASFDAREPADDSLGVDVGTALAEARRAGRPLLVLVIPRDEGARHDRGMAWGELINHGPRPALAALGQADVVCAFAAQLPVGTLPRGAEPLAVAFGPGVGDAAVPLNAELPRHASRGMVVISRKGKAPPAPPPDDVVTGQRIERLANLVTSALPPVPATRLAALSRDGDKQVKERPPRGAHWATGSGCGTHVEETPEEVAAREAAEERDRKLGILRGRTVVAYGCGMGHIPEKARRFLYFFKCDHKV
jgi:hypothetical protein